MSARHSSAAEVEAEHLRVLGPELGPLYHALHQEVAWLHAKWKQFRHLYAEPSNVDVLNQVAGFFFRVVHDVMWEDAVLHVARLTDPPRSVNKDNLTLLRLPDALPDARLRTQVDTLLQSAVGQATFARDWRNRHLAHRDLGLALGSGVEPLAAASRESMDRALAALRAVMNEVQRHYFNSTTAFEHFLAHDDAASLTYYLVEAVKAEARERDRWKELSVTPDASGPGSGGEV